MASKPSAASAPTIAVCARRAGDPDGQRLHARGRVPAQAGAVQPRGLPAQAGRPGAAVPQPAAGAAPELARARRPIAQRAGLEPRATCRACDGARILLVEDNANNREVALDFLAAAPRPGRRRRAWRRGGRMVQAGDYDLVLMDIQMPRDRRLERHAPDPRASAPARAADRGHDGARDGGRPRAQPGGRHERPHHQADRSGPAVPDPAELDRSGAPGADGAVPPAAPRSCRDGDTVPACCRRCRASTGTRRWPASATSTRAWTSACAASCRNTRRRRASVRDGAGSGGDERRCRRWRTISSRARPTSARTSWRPGAAASSRRCAAASPSERPRMAPALVAALDALLAGLAPLAGAARPAPAPPADALPALLRAPGGLAARRRCPRRDALRDCRQLLAGVRPCTRSLAAIAHGRRRNRIRRPRWRRWHGWRARWA